MLNILSDTTNQKLRDDTLKIAPLFLTFSVIILFLMTSIGMAAESTQYPLEITDAYGDTVTIEKQPQKIVSTMPSNTELLFAIGAGEYVIGGTIHDTYPPEAEEVEKIGGYATLDLEKIIDLDPDLVVAGYGNGEENINMMRDELGMNVVVLNPKTVDDIVENIELLGLITNNTEQATSIISGMQQQIETITQVTETIPEDARPRVLYIVWDDPMYAAGNNTFPNDLIEMAGGNNIMESDGWPMADLEDVVERDPEIIICSSMGAEDQSVSEELAEKIRNNELLAYTSAVQNHRVYPISDPKLIEIPGPRIVQGLEELHSILAPVTDEKMQEPGDLSAEESEGSKDSPGFGILLTCIAILSLFIANKTRK